MSRKSGAILILAGAIYGAAGMFSVALYLSTLINSSVVHAKSEVYSEMEKITKKKGTYNVTVNINSNGLKVPNVKYDNSFNSLIVLIWFFPTVLMWLLGFFFICFGNKMDNNIPVINIPVPENKIL